MYLELEDIIAVCFEVRKLEAYGKARRPEYIACVKNTLREDNTLPGWNTLHEWNTLHQWNTLPKAPREPAQTG